MRFTQVLPLAALGSALVLPEEHVFQDIAKSGRQLLFSSKNALDDAIRDSIAAVSSVGDNFHKIYDAGCDVDSWIEGDSFDDTVPSQPPEYIQPPQDSVPSQPPEYNQPPQDAVPNLPPDHNQPPHDAVPSLPPKLPPPPHLPSPPHFPKPPHFPSPPHPPSPPTHGPPHRGPPHHSPPHHGGPHHGHDKPNLTVYELISKSKYTTKLAKLIDEYDDLVETLNSTKANYTIFAPVDAAFEKIPKHGKKPSKEFIKSLLLYHINDSPYPAGRVLFSYTIPTLYKPEAALGHNQRLKIRTTPRGPTINFYSHIIAFNIWATNGVIHAIDSILLPPPPAATIIGLLPGQFSTLDLALHKTGLSSKLNSTVYPHQGGTLFAPSNFAFQKLGLKINAFLFSKYGEKYLKALLKYHIVVNQTLYSDAFIDATGAAPTLDDDDRPAHYDLPSALPDHFLSVDVRRFGPIISMQINGFASVTIHDGIAADGVIQVVSDVLIPPRRSGGKTVFWGGGEMSVEEFKEWVGPLVKKEEDVEQDVEEDVMEL